MSYALRPVGYLGAFDPTAYYGPSGAPVSNEDQMRAIAGNMANELWARSESLAQTSSAITRASSFSSRALNSAIELANQASRTAGGGNLQLTRDQFVSSVQAAVAQLAAMAISIKTLAAVPDIVRAWPTIGLLAVNGAALDQATRAMLGAAQYDETRFGVSGLGFIAILTHPVVLAAAAVVIIVGIGYYVAYQRGLRDAQQASATADSALRTLCPTPASCTFEQRLAAWRAAYGDAVGPSVVDLIGRVLDSADAANREWTDIFKKPVLYVAVIGGVAVLGALGYAAWPYLQSVRSVGSRHAKRLKAAEED